MPACGGMGTAPETGIAPGTGGIGMGTAAIGGATP